MHIHYTDWKFQHVANSLYVTQVNCIRTKCVTVTSKQLQRPTRLPQVVDSNPEVLMAQEVGHAIPLTPNSIGVIVRNSMQPYMVATARPQPLNYLRCRM